MQQSKVRSSPTIGQGLCESSASGKVILVGEHAVVYGANAVAMPLSSMPAHFNLTKITQSPTPGSKLYMQGELMSAEVCAIVDEALELIGRKQYVATVKGFSNAPIGAGLGASASLAVGILRVLDDFFALGLERRNLAVLANQLEKRFHGTPSGLDTAVVSYEQPIRFSRPNLIQPLTIRLLQGAHGPRKWPFVLIDSGIRSPTREMIDVTKPYFSGAAGLRRVEKFNSLASAVERALATSDTALMAQTLNDAHESLDDAGVVTSELKAIKEHCQKIGALACKPTGAGGGGCMLALLDPGQDDQQLQKLQSQFGKHFIYEVYCG